MDFLQKFMLTIIILGVILSINSCMCAVNIGGDQNVYMDKETNVYAETDATIPWGL